MRHDTYDIISVWEKFYVVLIVHLPTQGIAGSSACTATAV